MLTALHALAADLQYAVRLLRKNPLFALPAVLSLGLAIGVNAAMFSLFNSLLWRPLPVDRPNDIVRIYSKTPSRPVLFGFSFPDYRDYASEGVLDDLAAFRLVQLMLGAGRGDCTMVTGEAVSANYFSTLKPRMLLGRGIRPEEGRLPSGEPVVVLGFNAWQHYFNGDRTIVGRVVRLSNQPFTVVGVTAPEFMGTYSSLTADDIWIPIPVLARMGSNLEDRRVPDFFLFGRLHAGSGVGAARAAAQVVAARLADVFPETSRGVQPVVLPDADTRPFINLARPARGIATAFTVIAGLVLLIACANVATLLLGRATARCREIAIRLALGATRAQLIRQFLAESLVLSLLASPLGLAVAAAAGRLLKLLPLSKFGLPVVLEPHTDSRVVIYTFAISLAAGLVFGLAPALRSTRRDAIEGLKARSDASVVGSGRVRLLGAWRKRLTLPRVLVVAQIATSLLLLVLAGLFARSVSAVATVDLGFEPTNRVTVEMLPSLAGYTPDRAAAYYRALLDRVKRAPSVGSAALESRPPFSLYGQFSDATLEGRVARRGEEKVDVALTVVGPGYFDTLGVRLGAGRPIEEQDKADSRLVVVVNEVAARRFWPGQDPLGKRLRLDAAGGWLEVVGVAPNVKYQQLFEPPMAQLFVPYAQQPRVNMGLMVKSRGDLASTIAAVRRELAAGDPDIPIVAVKTMAQQLERQQVLPTTLASLVVPAALLACVIAVIGLYAVMAYSVSRRTREIGIRVAIGAAPRNVLRTVMSEGAAMTALGVVVGLAAAFALTRMVSALLFGVSATDPRVFIGVPAALLLVAAAACYVPARRALAVQPLVALRHE